MHRLDVANEKKALHNNWKGIHDSGRIADSHHLGLKQARLLIQGEQQGLTCDAQHEHHGRVKAT